MSGWGGARERKETRKGGKGKRGEPRDEEGHRKMTKRLGKTRERKGKQKEEKRVVDRLEREGGWERKMRR